MTGYGIIDEKIPVVMLTGGWTYSAANCFAAIMKSLPNVTLMGTRTGGGGSARFTLVMPNGWRFFYSSAPMYDIYYNSLEAGVEPHYTIPTTAADAEEAEQTGIHRLMETAYQYLNKNE
jgi:C-terminal processing protease CtpA/Prc